MSVARPPRRLLRALASGAALAALVVVASDGAAREALPAPWSGRVVGAADGDTVTVMRAGRGVKVRLWGVDTPEKSQDFGNAAKRFTWRTVGQKAVQVEPRAVDRYGRTVALVRSDGGLLNEALVRAGYAWVYRSYCDREALCDRWLALEAAAREAGRGLWAHANPVPPWSFRRAGLPDRRKDAAEATGPFHGNTRSLKFHAPGCPVYDCKRCTATFPTRAGAVGAGYVPCGLCRP